MYELAPRTPELSPAASHYLDIVEGLDQYSRKHFGEEIVDHDFTPDHGRSLALPQDSAGFKEQIDALLQGIPDDEPNAGALRRNLSSTRRALEVLAGELIIGKNIDYCDYVEAVMGVRPALVPETIEEGGAESLEGQRTEIEKIVEQLGYHYRPGSHPDFNREHIIPENEMPATVRELIGAAKEAVAHQVGPELAAGMEEIDVQTVKDKDGWQGFFGTENKEFIIKMNVHPSVKVSRLEELQAIKHEFTHGASAAHKKKLVAAGELSPALANLLVFSPAYFQEEVTARAVEPDIAGDGLPLFPEYIYRETKYHNDVWHNMMIRVNTGWTEDETAAYGLERLPFGDPKKLKLDAEMFKRRLVYKSVFAVDHEAIRIGRRIAALPQEEKQAVLTQLCSGPLEVADILALGQPATTPLAA